MNEMKNTHPNNKREPFRAIRSKFVLVDQDNIDTDQIMPARFLTTTERAGMGDALFADWRFDKDGNPDPECVFNQESAKERKILVAGDNFGCGSSREHAPWGLHDFGFRAVLSTDFADIFRSNSLKNGLLPVVISEYLYAWLRAHPDAEIDLDLETGAIHYGDGTGSQEVFRFEIEPFARNQLLAGMDDLDFLMSNEDAITEFEAANE